MKEKGSEMYNFPEDQKQWIKHTISTTMKENVAINVYLFVFLNCILLFFFTIRIGERDRVLNYITFSNNLILKPSFRIFFYCL